MRTKTYTLVPIGIMGSNSKGKHLIEIKIVLVGRKHEYNHVLVLIPFCHVKCFNQAIVSGLSVTLPRIHFDIVACAFKFL